MDPYRQRQISQSDCEISSNCGKIFSSCRVLCRYNFSCIDHVLLLLYINGSDNKGEGPQLMPSFTSQSGHEKLRAGQTS